VNITWVGSTSPWMIFNIDIYFAWLASFVRAYEETMIFFVCKKYLRQWSAKLCMDGKVVSKESCLQKSSHNIKYSGFTNHISLPRKDIFALYTAEVFLYKHKLPNSKLCCIMRHKTIKTRREWDQVHSRLLACSTLMMSKV
jgi:hypothetical protein